MLARSQNGHFKSYPELTQVFSCRNLNLIFSGQCSEDWNLAVATENHITVLVRSIFRGVGHFSQELAKLQHSTRLQTDTTGHTYQP